MMPPGDIFRVFERGGRNIDTQFPEIGLPNIERRSAEARRAGPAGHPPVEPRSRHRPARRRSRPQHHQDAAQRSASCGSWAPTTSRATIASRAARLPRHLRQRPRAAGMPAPMRQFGNDRQSASARSDHSPRTNRAIRCATCSRASFPTVAVHDLPHAPAEHVREQLSRLHDVGLRVRCAVHVAGEAEISDQPRRCARSWTAIPKRRRSRGKWGDPDFLRNVSTLNPKLKDTQFADYHGHGWNFRAVFKRDRNGTSARQGRQRPVADDDPREIPRRPCI